MNNNQQVHNFSVYYKFPFFTLNLRRGGDFEKNWLLLTPFRDGVE